MVKRKITSITFAAGQRSDIGRYGFGTAMTIDDF